jgi:hypothetical protein
MLAIATAQAPSRRRVTTRRPLFRYKTGTFAMIRDAKRLQATRSKPPGQAAISELGGLIGSFLLAVDVDAVRWHHAPGGEAVTAWFQRDSRS